MISGDVPDPNALYRVRDGAYAADLLIGAVVEFDVFSWLAVHGAVPAAVLRAGLGLAERPTDVLLTYCAALGLVDRDVDADDRIELTELGRRHLVAGSPFDLRPYYASLAERPAVGELVDVLRHDRPAAWASANPLLPDTLRNRSMPQPGACSLHGVSPTGSMSSPQTCSPIRSQPGSTRTCSPTCCTTGTPRGCSS